VKTETENHISIIKLALRSATITTTDQDWQDWTRRSRPNSQQLWLFLLYQIPYPNVLFIAAWLVYQGIRMQEMPWPSVLLY
jgi:hypothetical protein